MILKRKWSKQVCRAVFIAWLSSQWIAKKIWHYFKGEYWGCVSFSLRSYEKIHSKTDFSSDLVLPWSYTVCSCTTFPNMLLFSHCRLICLFFLFSSLYTIHCASEYYLEADRCWKVFIIIFFKQTEKYKALYTNYNLNCL